MKRVNAPELMDGAPLPPAIMRDALWFLALSNRWFGGTGVILRRLEAWSGRWDPGREITILDAGTGAADIPVAIAAWADRRGFRVRITAAELVPEAAAVARDRTKGVPAIEVVQADVFALLAGGGVFDFVIASLFLHHMPPDRHSPVLQAFDRAARRGVIVSDLGRSAAGYAAVWLLAHAAGNRVVRHDGPLSVRRAFTISELDALARGAGLPYLRAAREPWFRVSLAGEKTP